MSSESKIKKPDTTGLDFFGNGEPECFNSLLCFFDSGLKCWTQVSSWVANVEILRVSMEVSQKCPGNVNPFSLYSGTSILETYLAVKIVWTKPEL